MGLRFCWLLACLVSVLACETQIVRVHRGKDAIAEAHGADASASTPPETQPQPRHESGPIECPWTVIYRDEDHDGYGNPSLSVKHCVDDPIADGWTSKGGDCDDKNPNVNVSCTELPKQKACPNHCSDNDPYTWGFCQEDDVALCDKPYASWIELRCDVPSQGPMPGPHSLECIPFGWVTIPGETHAFNLNYQWLSVWQGQNVKGAKVSLNPKPFCESLAQPGATLRVNTLTLDPSNKSIKSIGGKHTKATDGFWWGSKNNPKTGKPDTVTIFDQPDYVFTFDDFPLCVMAKKEVEAGGKNFP